MGTFPQYDHPHTLRRYAEIAESLNLGGNNDEEKTRKTNKKNRRIKRKNRNQKTIKEYGIEEEKIFSNIRRNVRNGI